MRPIGPFKGQWAVRNPIFTKLLFVSLTGPSAVGTALFQSKVQWPGVHWPVAHWALPPKIKQGLLS